MFNFLALLDIRVFGRLYLWLLIGLALFLQPGCFYLASLVTGIPDQYAKQLALIRIEM